MKNSFRGQEVTVTKDLGEYVQAVLNGKLPYGLDIQMENFVEVYGELQNSAPGQGTSNPFHISPTSGPCWVICGNCGAEFDEPTIAALGKNSVMAAFGMPPVLECRSCGNSSAVIVAA